MNAMGHGIPTVIGVDHSGVAGRIMKPVPDYMVMGEHGMKGMTEMEMPLPDNTGPMMAGNGPLGVVGMGGMFSVLKVRKDQKPGDHTDPGWYQHPPGAVAYEFAGELADAPRGGSERRGVMPRLDEARTPVETTVRKPGAPASNHQH